jgi:hypothetical protein
MLKSKGKTNVVEEPSRVKKLSLNHVCKIGLNGLFTKVVWLFRDAWIGPCMDEGTLNVVFTDVRQSAVQLPSH